MNWYEQMTGKTTPDRFAQQLIEGLRQAGDERRVTFDAQRFQLRFASDGRAIGVATLRNLYEEFKMLAARDRDDFFRFAVRSLLAAHKPIPADFEDARCDILLTVRNRTYFSLPELRNESKASRDESARPLAWPYQPLGEQLGVGLVYDLPEAMMMLQSSHLEDWGVSFYEAYECAISNLSELDATFCNDRRSFLRIQFRGSLRCESDDAI